MIKELPLIEEGAKVNFAEFEQKFKALADQKRLEIMHQLCLKGKICVCDLCDLFGMSQSKISYHLRILLDAGLIKKEIQGTWSYYEINSPEVNKLLSEELCCIFRPSC